MAIEILDPEVEQLAEEVALLASESKTDAIRHALLLRKAELVSAQAAGVGAGTRGRMFLEREVWPLHPPGSWRPLTREEEDEILGYGPGGV